MWPMTQASFHPKHTPGSAAAVTACRVNLFIPSRTRAGQRAEAAQLPAGIAPRVPVSRPPSVARVQPTRGVPRRPSVRSGARRPDHWLVPKQRGGRDGCGHAFVADFDQITPPLTEGTREPKMGANVVRRHATRGDPRGQFAQVSGSPIDPSRLSRIYRSLMACRRSGRARTRR
jgi:hypothetical protein